MIKKAFSIKNGLYLMVDPSMELHLMLQKVEAALKGGVSIIQILNNFKPNTSKVLIIESVSILAHRFGIPVLVNEDISYIEHVDGAHFNDIPQDFDTIKSTISSAAIIGITCDNNPEKVKWAIRHNVDYICFGSVFPTDSIPSYKIVHLENVRKARDYTDMPIFLCGGITPRNMEQLGDIVLDGIAVVSGIMNTEDPEESADSYVKAIAQIKKKHKQEAIM